MARRLTPDAPRLALAAVAAADRPHRRGAGGPARAHRRSGPSSAGLGCAAPAGSAGRCRTGGRPPTDMDGTTDVPGHAGGRRTAVASAWHGSVLVGGDSCSRDHDRRRGRVPRRAGAGGRARVRRRSRGAAAARRRRRDARLGARRTRSSRATARLRPCPGRCSRSARTSAPCPRRAPAGSPVQRSRPSRSSCRGCCWCSRRCRCSGGCATGRRSPPLSPGPTPSSSACWPRRS